MASYHSLKNFKLVFISSELNVNVANTLYLAFMSNKLEAAFTLLLTLLPRDGIFPDKISVVDTKQARIVLLEYTSMILLAFYSTMWEICLFFALKMLNEPEVKNWNLFLYCEEHCSLLKWQLYSAPFMVNIAFCREDNKPMFKKTIFLEKTILPLPPFPRIFLTTWTSHYFLLSS